MLRPGERPLFVADWTDALFVHFPVDPQVLQQFYTRVKTGVRGLGFVRTKADVEWPAELQVKLPKAPEAKPAAVPADSSPPPAPEAQRSGDGASQTKAPDAK